MTTVLEIDKPQVGLSTNSGNSVLINDFMKANRYGRGERKKESHGSKKSYQEDLVFLSCTMSLK
jgi:hypothetical protein